MTAYEKLYINGQWVPSSGTDTLSVTDSATEEVIATIPEGTAADVDAAVAAAKAARIAGPIGPKVVLGVATGSSPGQTFAELARLVAKRDISARELLARAYDQMGYQSEAATWRNSYLTAAAELREGPPKKGVDRSFLIDVLNETPVERFLEAMAAGLDGPAADRRRMQYQALVRAVSK